MAVIPTSFGIYGTCVSIDVFDINRNSEILRAKKPIRATSVLSIDSRLVNCIRIEHESSWFEEMLRYVFDGRVKERIEKQRGEYCIIDFIEERFKLFKVDDGDMLFLNTSYCQQAQICDKLAAKGHIITEIDHYDLSEDYIEARIKEFAEFMCTVYEENKIIINEVYLVDQYTDGNTVSDFRSQWDKYIIKKSNDLFGFMYSCLKKFLPQARIINISEGNIGDANHYHECAPSHFIPQTYMRIFKELVKIVREDYSRQRNESLSPWMYRDLNSKSYYTKEILTDMKMPEEWISWFIEIGRRVCFEGKTVLQIGNGPIPKKVTRALKCKKWVYLSASISADNMDYDFKTHYVNPSMALSANNYISFNGTVDDLTFDFCDMFDIVISRGEIEKTKEIEKYFDKIYKILNRGGRYFERAGRIWSSSEGSKWKINSKHHFKSPQDMQPFPHLICTEEEIIEYLDSKYQWKFDKIRDEDNLSYADKVNIAKRIVKGTEDLNQLFYEDYRAALSNALFHIKMITPIFKYDVSEEYLNILKEKYYPYKVFNFKSLEIYCEK